MALFSGSSYFGTPNLILYSRLANYTLNSQEFDFRYRHIFVISAISSIWNSHLLVGKASRSHFCGKQLARYRYLLACMDWTLKDEIKRE